MRKRIKQMARGKFEYAKPELIFSEKEIAFSVIEGEEYTGEFFVENSGNTKIRGLVYSTNPRMKVLTSSFEGIKVRIRYQFQSYGLSEGLMEKGDFVIVCEQNEITLSFCVSISRKYMETSIGYIKNLYDFSCLAKVNWTEAIQLFYHKDFSNIIKSNEIKESMLYRAITDVKPSNQAMEEFLIGIRKKDKIHFSVDKYELTIDNITERTMESLEIKKDQWGYIEITAVTDADFICIDKKKICTDDFIGSVYNFEFYIEPKYLHGGRNFGKIQLCSVYESVDIEVTVRVVKDVSAIQKRMEKKKYLVKVMELYQDYRLKHIVTGVWAKDTIELLDTLHKLEPEEVMYPLMKAQCFIINKQKQEAEWLLNDFRRGWLDKKHPVWGYYLYLMTLIEKEPNYIERLLKEIEDIFYRNPDSDLMFWVTLFLREKYTENSTLKLKALKEWVMKGCSSPYLYIEAFYLIWNEPYLLTALGKFELYILRWAVKHQALSKDLVDRIFQLMEVKKGFSSVCYDLMCVAYQVSPKKEYTGCICRYLIRGQQFDYKYHKWFEMGIGQELRITSLYEAYLLSMDDRRVEPIPKIIQMYFKYENALPYKKMAVLYSNIIASKSSSPEVYQSYSRAMSRFAMEQVLEGHMNDNLAVVYDDMLDLGIIDEKIAKALSKIIFTHKVVIYDKKMIRAIIYQRQMKNPQVVSIVGNAAYFQLYSREYVIIFEDAKGQRYSGSIPYQIQSLMDTRKYLNKCLEMAPQELPYLLSYFDMKQNYLTYETEDKDRFGLLMFSEAVSGRYKARMLPEILRFYQINSYDSIIEEYLTRADYARLEESTRKFAMELLIDNRLFDFAYEKIQEYGIDQIGSNARMSLSDYLIDRFQGEEDTFTIQLAFSAFHAKKYNEKTLSYLCRHYNGPTRLMLDIWNTALGFGVDRGTLSERILVQMLYAENMVLEGMPVFACFYGQEGNDLITLAYVSECAQQYFIHNQRIHEDIFALIEARYICHMELNDVCRLSLLKFYAESSVTNQRQLKIEDELLAEYTRRNMNFAFYKRLHPELVLKYHLYDKVFLEYRANPYSHVVLHYSRDEDGENFMKEDMVDVYGGIFVKSFVMFFGEVIQYYISEERHHEVEVTESNRIVNNDIYNKKDNSRYNFLNQMLISNTLQEYEELYDAMKKYVEYEEVTQSVFKLL